MKRNQPTKRELEKAAAREQDIAEVLELIQHCHGALYNAAYGHFSALWEKATTGGGRICTRERMAALYPILREISDEIDADNADYAADQAKLRRQKERRQTRQLEAFTAPVQTISKQARQNSGLG